MKIGTNSRIRAGTASGDIQKILATRDIYLCPDLHNKRDALLYFELFKPFEVCNRPKYLYHGAPLPTKYMYKPRGWHHIKEVVFNSHFSKEIGITAYPEMSKNRVIYTIGGLPCDDDFTPIFTPRKLKEPIQFITIAKYYKRGFKRLRSVTKLFKEYILKEYPNSVLHIIGSKHKRKKGKIIYHGKSFYDIKNINILKRSHIFLTLSPFDTGPKTILESMHYRVPFVCANNCMGQDLIDMIGKCGRSTPVDPAIKNIKDWKYYDPIRSKKFYLKREIDYNIVMRDIREIINNYEEYTSWQWNDKLNYESEIDKWVDLFKN